MWDTLRRAIERLFNPRSWASFELHIDREASTGLLERYHGSVGFFFDELHRRGELPQGILSASGHDERDSVIVYIDTKVTAVDNVRAFLSSQGLRVTRVDRY